MATKASIQVGYTRNTLDNYQLWKRKNLTGIDVKGKDGQGNLIEVGIRECIISGQEMGFRIWINGKEVSYSERADDD